MSSFCCGTRYDLIRAIRAPQKRLSGPVRAQFLLGQNRGTLGTQRYPKMAGNGEWMFITQNISKYQIW